MDNDNKLLDWMRAASKEQREALAAHCETTVNYLYQLCGDVKNRRVPNVLLAVRIEDYTRANRSKGRPVVTVRDLAALAPGA